MNAKFVKCVSVERSCDSLTGLFREFPDERFADRFVRLLSPARQVPERLVVTRIPACNEQQRSIADEHSGGEMDAVRCRHHPRYTRRFAERLA